MGYTTEFEGSITISPALNQKEIDYINAFSDTRRMHRKNGPYFVGGDESDVIDYNKPARGQPELWCQWVVNEEGTEISWDGNEKFYSAKEWMAYIIDHFIGINPIAQKSNRDFDFLNGHICNGTIVADGEDSGDIWVINVVDNVVTTKRGAVAFD